MRKTIRVDQLRLGMHLHSLCGAWLDPPFWKTRFVLRDPADLDKLRTSGVQGCVIDIKRGLDVEPVPVQPTAAPTPAAPAGHPHERPDGQGYPDGLSGAAFSRLARMGAVCEVYDAISSNRPYKEGWLPADSIASMAEWTRAGKFEAAVFRAFIDGVGIYPAGSLVRLDSQRLAVVVEHNPKAPLTPRVKVFYSLRSQLMLPIEMLDLGHDGCRGRIVGRESNARWRFPYIDTLAAPLADAAPVRPGCKETV